jgi:Arginase/agmatinase/formimionoglutamate hydrolase, arginase family
MSAPRGRQGDFPSSFQGNCLAAVGVIAGLGPGTGVIWIDAHGDFNTPQTTTSGFLDGMTLAHGDRAVLGRVGTPR